MIHEERNSNSEKRAENEEKTMRMDDQLSEPQYKLQSSSQYFIGLGIGLVPLILMLIAIGGLVPPASIGCLFIFLDGTLFITSIVCLCNKRIRFAGCGLLTMAIAIPVISFVELLVIVQRQLQLYG